MNQLTAQLMVLALMYYSLGYPLNKQHKVFKNYCDSNPLPVYEGVRENEQ